MKPNVAVTGLTGCSGCQLMLLNLEPQLPEILEKVVLHLFPMAEPTDAGTRYDAVLVDGAVSSTEQAETLARLRERCGLLIAFGTCAGWGGVNCLRNGEDRGELVRQVYGDARRSFDTFPPKPLASFVRVDGFIPGCPPEKSDILRVIGSLLHGTLPEPFPRAVCAECREAENRCLLMEENEICLGPVTEGGCAARCPSINVPCEGCRGPVERANRDELAAILMGKGFDPTEIRSRLSRFSRGEMDDAGSE